MLMTVKQSKMHTRMNRVIRNIESRFGGYTLRYIIIRANDIAYLDMTILTFQILVSIFILVQCKFLLNIFCGLQKGLVSGLSWN